MSHEIMYINAKEKILNDKTICKDNRDLFKKFFEWEEYKLKRKNNLSKIDESSYKTLYQYTIYFKVVNNWFNNKAWKDLTKRDIKKVYDGIEDGTIKTRFGTPVKNKVAYYNKIFRSKPFDLVGKAELAREVMEFYTNDREGEVRFIEIEDFKKIINVIIRPDQKLLCWLAFDIGENIEALLKLQKKDIIRQINPDDKSPEYRVNLPKDKIKRSRKSRSEITNFKETVELADIVLQDLKDEEYIFKFEYRQAKKFFDRTIEITKVKCIPEGQKPTWKDLRSSMACYLLKNDWSSDEINSRLGHRPSSRVLDKYINFLALDRHKPKKKLYNNTLQKINTELEEAKEIIKLQSRRFEEFKEKIEKRMDRYDRSFGNIAKDHGFQDTELTREFFKEKYKAQSKKKTMNNLKKLAKKGIIEKIKKG